MPNTCKQTQTNKVWKNWQHVEKEDTQPIFLGRIMKITNTHTHTHTKNVSAYKMYICMYICTCNPYIGIDWATSASLFLLRVAYRNEIYESVSLFVFVCTYICMYCAYASVCECKQQMYVPCC